jgi:hypothetical protein
MPFPTTIFRRWLNRRGRHQTQLAINAGEAHLEKHIGDRITGPLLDELVRRQGDDAGLSVPDQAYTYLLFHPRDALLGVLPAGGVAAEVGVAKGAFSRRILALNRPRTLHLIDPWVAQADPTYAPDPGNAPQPVHEERYAKVLRKLRGPIARGQVVVHREFSKKAAAAFAPETFDWVYIDAMHTFDAALADLRAFAPLTKPEGFLWGHDFSNHPLAKDMNFGVIEAVKAFVDEGAWRLVCVTADEYPSFVLARRGTNEQVRKLEIEILEKFTFITVKDFLARNFRQNLYINRKNRNVNMYVSID